MNAEQGVIERQDISIEELDELSQAVFELSAADIDRDEPDKDPLTSFLETFATGAQLEALEKVKEGTMVGNTKEATLWRRFQAGILWHPAIIGKLAELSGVESPEDLYEDAWKDQGDCKEDLRFVSNGNRRKRNTQETRELMDVCEGCPVLAQCTDYVTQKSWNYGFWAGVARSYGMGYHEDGTAITLEEKREMMEARATKPARS